MENCIPKFWEREREWKIAFPTFGNGNGNEKIIPNFREREWEASIRGNGRKREFPLSPESGPLIHGCQNNRIFKGFSDFPNYFWNAQILSWIKEYAINNCQKANGRFLFELTMNDLVVVRRIFVFSIFKVAAIWRTPPLVLNNFSRDKTTWI